MCSTKLLSKNKVTEFWGLAHASYAAAWHINTDTYMDIVFPF